MGLPSKRLFFAALLTGLSVGCSSLPPRGPGNDHRDSNRQVIALLPSQLDSVVSPSSPTVLSSLDEGLARELEAHPILTLLPSSELERSYASILREGPPAFDLLVEPRILSAQEGALVLRVAIRGKDARGRPVGDAWSQELASEADIHSVVNAFSSWFTQRPYIAQERPPDRKLQARASIEMMPGTRQQGPHTGVKRPDGLIELHGLPLKLPPGTRLFARGKAVTFTDPVTGEERVLSQGSVHGLLVLVEVSQGTGAGRVLSGEIEPGLLIESADEELP